MPGPFSKSKRHPWIYDPSLSIRELEEAYLRHEGNPTVLRLIRREINGRLGETKPTSFASKWARVHNWALFQISGAKGISNQIEQLRKLVKENSIGRSFGPEYEEVIQLLISVRADLHSAEQKLRMITIEKKREDQDRS